MLQQFTGSSYSSILFSYSLLQFYSGQSIYLCRAADPVQAALCSAALLCSCNPPLKSALSGGGGFFNFFSRETLIRVFNIRSFCQVSRGSAGCSLQLCCAPLCSWHQTNRTDGRQRLGPNTTGHNAGTRCCISLDLFFILFSMSRHRGVIFGSV